MGPGLTTIRELGLGKQWLHKASDIVLKKRVGPKYPARIRSRNNAACSVADEGRWVAVVARAPAVMGMVGMGVKMVWQSWE